MPAALSQLLLNPAFRAGYDAGLQGTLAAPAFTAAARAASSPTAREWDDFLAGVRSRQLASRGPRNEGAEACADAFVSGALEVFPAAKEMVFLRTLGRVWGMRQSPTSRPLALPVGDELSALSRDVGRHGGRTLREDYETGLKCGFGRTVLEAKLHLREIDDYLAVAGWLAGTAETLKGRFPERHAILSGNHASLLHRAFHRGDRTYPEKAVEALPAMLQCLDLEIARWEMPDPDAAGALKCNRLTVVNRAFHSGRLNYPQDVFESLPAMIKTLDDAMGAWSEKDAELAGALRANRSSVISRALNRGNFRYPAQAVKALPDLFKALDKEIRRIESTDAATAELLRANRGSIITRALAYGDFRYPAKVLKTLEEARINLEAAVKRLSRKNAQAAAMLRAEELSLLSRVLNTGNAQYPSKAAGALPSLLKSLKAAVKSADPKSAAVLEKNLPTVVHRTIGSGEFGYGEAAAGALTRKPGLLQEIQAASEKLSARNAAWKSRLEGASLLILGKALRTGKLDGEAACLAYLNEDS